MSGGIYLIRDDGIFGAYTGYENGYVQIPFMEMKQKPSPPFDSETMREELRQRLDKIQGADMPRESIEKHPSFPLEALEAAPAMERFLEVFDWVYREMRKSL